MTLRIEEKEDRRCVFIEGEMTIYCAAELKGELVAAIDCDRPVEVDFSRVEEIDCAGLQLMLTLGMSNPDGRVYFGALSPAVSACLETFGLSPLPLVVSGRPAEPVALVEGAA